MALYLVKGRIFYEDGDKLSLLNGSILNSETSAGGVDDLLAENVESSSEVTSPAIGQVHVLTADDVQSVSEVTSPAIGQKHVLAANDAESASEVSVPSVGQSNVLTANDVESASEVTSPAIGQAHVLAANDAESNSEVSTSAIGQVHVLTADDVESNSEVSVPTLTEGTNALLAEDVESISEITVPSIGQVHVLLANDVESSSEVSSPTLDRPPVEIAASSLEPPPQIIENFTHQWRNWLWYLYDFINNHTGGFAPVAPADGSSWNAHGNTATGDMTIVGDLSLDGDDVSSAVVFGEEQDSAVYYDGTDLVIDTQLVGSGNLRLMSGSTPIETDSYVRHVQIQAALTGNPSNNPASVSFGTVSALQFATTGTKYAYCQWEVPNDWDGSDVIIEIDWCPNSGAMTAPDTVIWDVEYRAIAEGEILTAGTVATGSVTINTSLAQYYFHHAAFTIAAADANQPLAKQDHVFFQFSRDTSDPDDFSGTAAITEFEIVYNSNGIPTSN